MSHPFLNFYECNQEKDGKMITIAKDIQKGPSIFSAKSLIPNKKI